MGINVLMAYFEVRDIFLQGSKIGLGGDLVPLDSSRLNHVTCDSARLSRCQVQVDSDLEDF